MQAIPPEKVIPGTGFVVDGFRHSSPDVQAYFLSHAHSDHYTGLTENWDQAIIYCSLVTARLLHHLVGVKKQYIHPLAMHEVHHIQGVKVILVDANHCPGAVQFLFELPNGDKYIHCGDMRFGKHLLQDANLAAFQGAAAVFLDTTYCNPKYTFPPQEQAVEYVADTVSKLIDEQKQHNIKRIYVVSTYVIGKERLLVAIHKKTGHRIGVTQQKMDTLKCLELPGVELDEVFTTDMESTPVHVVKWGFLGESWPFFRPNFVNMEEYRTERNVDEVIGFLPTGWMYEMKRKSFPVRDKGHCFIHLVPYSEHSSYSELREYVQFLHPHKVVPTVGVHDDASGKKSSGLQKHFRHLVNETASKHKFLRSLHRSSSSREGSGSLQPGASSVLADSTTTVKPAEEPQIAARTRSCKGANASPAVAQKHVGRRKSARSQVGSSARIKQEEREEHLDADGLPDLPESLGNALGDASGDALASDALTAGAIKPAQQVPDHLGDAMEDEEADTLQADPDVLLQDSMQPEIECNPRKEDSSDCVATPLASVTDCLADPACDAVQSKAVNELLSILAGSVDAATAASLVAKAHGNLAAAINLFYDSPNVNADGNHAQQPTSSAETARASDLSADVSADSCHAVMGNASVSKLSKQASQPSVGKQSRRGSKRAASGVDASQNKGAVKKAKGPPQTGQRSIATFFGGHNVRKQSNIKEEGAHIKEEDVQDLTSEDDVVVVKSADDDMAGVGHASTDPLSGAADTDMETNAGILAAGNDTVKSGLESDMAGAQHIKQEAGTKLAELTHIKHEPTEATYNSFSDRHQQTNSEHQNQHQAQPVHPFFNASHSKATSKAAATAKSPLPASKTASQAATVQEEADASAQNAEQPSSVSKPKLINPFQKPRSTAEEKDVPAGAVLLSVADYDPVGMALWEAGQATPYRHISRAFQAMESTTKRLRIGDAIANMFRSILALSPDDMLHAAYLTIGKLAPDYENVELSVGGSTVAAAVVEATGISRARLRDMYTELGDMGDVAQACRHTQTMLHKPAPLTVPAVYKTLRQIAIEKGPGSASRRQQAVLGMLRSCREHETKFLVRTLVSNLRVGANWRSVIGAMARAVVLHKEGPRVSKARLDAAATAASEAFHVCPTLDILVPALVEGGIEELEKRCTLTPGVPLKPMLAKISEGVPDAIKQLKGAPFLAEYKYDGTRAQIHLLADNSVKIFSRNCEDKTVSMPDVVAAIQAAAQGGSTSLVIDAELVAVERGDNNRLKAFQELSTRARGEVAAHQVTMHVCVFVFDLLYVDGDSLVHLPLRQRRARLAQALPNLEPGFVQFATSMEFRPAALAAAAETAAPDAATPAEAAAAVSAAAAADAHAEASAQPYAHPQDPQRSSQSDSHRTHEMDNHLDTDAGPQQDPQLAASRNLDATCDADAEQECDMAPPGTTDAVACMPGAAEVAPDTATADAQAVVNVSDVALLSIEERIQEFLLESFAGGTEGLMLKALDVAAGYQPSKRSDSWIKLKKDYCEGLRDSLDLVVIGAWYGQGRKTKWYSPFLLAAYNPETEELQSVCRCMSGYTDAFYAEATARLSETVVPTKKPYIITDESPNVWFEPKEVWEIRGADLTISPVHKAALGLIHPDRGISLRFPRFITIRDDKKPEDASTPEIIADLYNKQNRRMASAAEMLANKSKASAAGSTAGIGTNGNEQVRDDDEEMDG